MTCFLWLRKIQHIKLTDYNTHIYTLYQNDIGHN